MGRYGSKGRVRPCKTRSSQMVHSPPTTSLPPAVTGPHPSTSFNPYSASFWSSSSPTSHSPLFSSLPLLPYIPPIAPLLFPTPSPLSSLQSPLPPHHPLPPSSRFPPVLSFLYPPFARAKRGGGATDGAPGLRSRTQRPLPPPPFRTPPGSPAYLRRPSTSLSRTNCNAAPFHGTQRGELYPYHSFPPPSPFSPPTPSPFPSLPISFLPFSSLIIPSLPSTSLLLSSPAAWI